MHLWLQPGHLWLQSGHLWLQVLRLDAEAQLAQARHEAQLAPVAESMPTTPPRGLRGGLPPETMPMPTMPVMPLPRAAFRRAYLLCFGKMQHAFRKDMLEAKSRASSRGFAKNAPAKPVAQVFGATAANVD